MSKKEYVLDSLFEDIPKEDYNESWCEHKEQVRNMLQKGLYGFIGGALIFGFLMFVILSAGNDAGSLAFSETWPWILAALGVGIMCIGFPFGWELLNRLVGQWSIWGNLFIVIALFVFKLAFALMIGMFAYPIFLIYHIIKSQKSKRRVRLWAIIVICVVVLWNVFLGIYAIIDAKSNPGEDNPNSTTSSSVQHYATADEIPMDIAQQIADQLVSEKQKDNDADPNFTYTDVELYGIFFLEGKEDAWADENQLHFVIHYNMLDDNGEVQNVYYTPMYIKDIIVQADGRITLQRDDCVAPFSYSSAEAYTEKYADDYDITEIG